MTAPKSKAASAYLSLREVADHLGVGLTLLRGLVARRELLAVDVGAAKRIARRELERYEDRLRLRAEKGPR